MVKTATAAVLGGCHGLSGRSTNSKDARPVSKNQVDVEFGFAGPGKEEKNSISKFCTLRGSVRKSGRQGAVKYPAGRCRVSYGHGTADWFFVKEGFVGCPLTCL